MRTGLSSRLPTLAALWVLSAALGSSPAAAEELSSVLLPIEGDRSLPALNQELAAAFKNQGRALQRSSLGLEDLMLALGCQTLSVACLQEIGRSVKAAALILPSARQASGGVELSLRWFDVKSGGDAGQVARVLPRDSVARQAILAETVRALLEGRSPRAGEQTGRLSIASSLPYVEILLDGQARGTAPLDFRNLPVGSYRVTGRREGFLDWQGTARVEADKVTQLRIELAPAPGQPGRGSYFEMVRPHTWAVGGAGLLCLAIGGAFAAHMKSEQDQLNKTRGVTLDEIHRMQSFKETGETDALAANVLFGIGGAALITAVVLSYFDYRHGRAESSELRALRIGPGSVSVKLGF